MTLRDRLVQTLWPEGKQELAALRGKVRELGYAQQVLNVAFDVMPAQFVRPELGQQLSETNSDAYRWYTELSNWETIGNFGSAAPTTEADRRAAVELSRMGFQTLTLVERMVNMWIDFAVSAKPTVLIDDTKAQEDWNDFWQADQNLCVLSQSRLPMMFQQQLVDGEVFPTFFINKVKGGPPTIRLVNTDQVSAILRPDGDDMTNLGYVRTSLNGDGAQMTRYYRDWAADLRDFEQALVRGRQSGGMMAHMERPATDVVMQHVWFTGPDRRGWPAFSKAVWWARRYQDFMSWRLTLAKAVATFMEDITTKGGSRDVASIVAALQSSFATGGESETNPVAPVGSPFVHNEAVKRNRMPLSTGAGDAQIDGMTVLSYAGLAAGIPPHWLGRPDMMQNRATARELLLPTMRQWTRYQSMWKDVFKEWARIVLQSAQTYPQEQRSRYKKPIAEMTITVTMPAALSSAEFAELVAALGTLTAGNILRPEEAAHIALSMPELGIEDPDEVYKAMFPVEAEGGPDAVTLPAAPSTPTPEDKLSVDKTPTQAATAERAIVEAAIRRIMDDPFEEGGPGSGNFGHEGRPGAAGGSGSSANGIMASGYSPPLSEGIVDYADSQGWGDVDNLIDAMDMRPEWHSFTKDNQRWTRGAEQDAKEDIVSWLKDPKIRTATLYATWSSQMSKAHSGGGDADVAFRDWVEKPQRLYRSGGRSEPFMSFSTSARAAEDAGKQGMAWEISAAPKQWLGAGLTGAGEIYLATESIESIGTVTDD